MYKKLVSTYPLFILLFVFFLVVIFTYKDFGITADEELEYYLGTNLRNHFFDSYSFFANTKIVEKPYLGIYYHFYPMILTILNFKGYYEWYHLLNFLFSSILIVSSYLLFNYVYKDKFKALIAPIIILLTPQLFGHFPVNPKDMPFAVMYFLSIALIYILNRTKSPTFIKCAVLGLVFGFSQSLRIIGYTLYILYIFDLLSLSKKNIKLKIKELLLIIFISHSFMFLTFPYLRENIFNLYNLIVKAGSFTFWKREALFFGEFITKDNRPWYYLPTYLLLTLPVPITLLHFLSFKGFKKDSLLKLILLAIYLNIIMYFLLQPIVYNGLRHFLYLLPLISFTAGIAVFKSLNAFPFLKVLYIVFAVFILIQMVRIHPYQYIYYNPLAHAMFDIEKTFETDYWGASYKEATKIVITYMEANNVLDPKVYPCDVAFAVNYYALGKFRLVNKSSEADIIMCDIEEDIKRGNNHPVMGVIKKDNMILNVIRLSN